MNSAELQEKALAILNTIGDGLAGPQVKAIRGVGFAILALVQFLRESEGEIVPVELCCDDCGCDALDVMQEGING